MITHAFSDFPHLYLSLIRCLDDSGGYLHHAPGMACRIVTACCCLHNLARRHYVPVPIPEADEDVDGQRRMAHIDRGQPPAEVRPAAAERRGDLLSRAAFIRDLFYLH